ncbi:MAG: hypothetical protein ACHQVS_02100 [Candidatus Babeliales bacterium]
MRRYSIAYLCMIALPLAASDTVQPVHDNITIQQIGPLFCFGQNILPRNTVTVRAIPFYYKQTHHSFSYMSAQLLYGVTDQLVLLFDTPIIFNNHGYGNTHRLGDVRIQAEYAYYKKRDASKSIEATVLGNCIIPRTFSTDRNPLTAGETSFFFGTTASYLTDWYAYASLGGRIVNPFKSTHFGNQVLYEWIIGHRLPDIPHVNTYLLIESNGIYTQKDTIHGSSDPNTGSNLIYCGPVLVVTSINWALLAGVQGVATQHRNGNQEPFNLRASLMLVYKF